MKMPRTTRERVALLRLADVAAEVASHLDPYSIDMVDEGFGLRPIEVAALKRLYEANDEWQEAQMASSRARRRVPQADEHKRGG